MLQTGEVLVHCMDVSLLKNKNIADVFPPVAKYIDVSNVQTPMFLKWMLFVLINFICCRFPMIGCCSQTRRIAFGGKSGAIVIHELRAGKSQVSRKREKALKIILFFLNEFFIIIFLRQYKRTVNQFRRAVFRKMENLLLLIRPTKEN